MPCVKSVREPDAANPHVRFDERGEETERLSPSPRLTSTLRAPCKGARSRKQGIISAGSLTVRPESVADGAGGNECAGASREVPRGGMSE